MKNSTSSVNDAGTDVDVSIIIDELKHYLPAQAPLKDFIHHNTLHGFQDADFHNGLNKASAIFGYKTYLTLDEYRQRFMNNLIKGHIVEDILEKKYADVVVRNTWRELMHYGNFEHDGSARIGSLRNHWKSVYKLDLDALVHPLLFRILCSYLDQGISIWKFPVHEKGFFVSIRDLERNSFHSFFRTERARNLILSSDITIEMLLDTLVGSKDLYKHYLFDQQFSHQGWSGMVAAIERQPSSLIDRKNISLNDVILLELLLEIDAVEFVHNGTWQGLAQHVKDVHDIFAPVDATRLHIVLSLWHDAMEWSYYDEVFAGLKQSGHDISQALKKNFQALFCIDDRECSLRRYVEEQDRFCETFGTPGFFGVEFYFKPENSNSYTKLCPAPMNPQFMIKEVGRKHHRKKDFHFSKLGHTLFGGWLISQTLGFWSAFRLFLNVFRPSMSPATASSLHHMDKVSQLTIEAHGDLEDGLKVGFDVDEMTLRVSNLLKSIGLVAEFAPIVYVIGHGSSSVNNPHYAAYDCGACSGRPGSVNARVLAFMANHARVREKLRREGIAIPDATQFVGGLHDTTRDEIVFYDEQNMSAENYSRHVHHVTVFEKALLQNAKERSRRFFSIDPRDPEISIRKKIRQRSVSIFQPRPELNHATNALCVVGRRALTRDLFLDRRSFLNSYNHEIDPEGEFLTGILKAAAPVCGGINLEYFFSRVDNQKLGAGSKLPHNVMGLFAVANGIDGDLRPGLPSQMIEVHDPIRLMIVVEHHPEVVLKAIKRDEATYQWFAKGWVHLVAIKPDTKNLFYFRHEAFQEYQPLMRFVRSADKISDIIESSRENLPVYLIN